MSFRVRLSVLYQSKKSQVKCEKNSQTFLQMLFPNIHYTKIQISISPNAQYNKRMFELQTKVTPYKHKTR